MLSSLHLTLNLSKTKFMLMTTGKRNRYSIEVGGHKIEQVQNLKWLGRIIDANSTVKEHIGKLKNCITPGKNLLSKLTTIKAGIAPNIGLNLFKVIVRSKAEYANTSYSNASKCQ